MPRATRALKWAPANLKPAFSPILSFVQNTVRSFAPIMKESIQPDLFDCLIFSDIRTVFYFKQNSSALHPFTHSLLFASTNIVIDFFYRFDMT